MNTTTEHLCEIVAAQMGGMFICKQVGQHVRIRTPFMYPDGDVIDLFVKQGESGEVTVTDLGETLSWLRMQTAANKRTSKQLRMIDDVVSSHGIERYKGMLVTRADRSGFADAVIKLAQGCLRVSDVWFTFRNRSFETATDEVEDFLTEKNIEFERNKECVGRSGKVRRLDFHTFTQNSSTFIQILSTGSRGAATRLVEHALAVWYDIHYLKKQDLTFVSLFDDTMDIWRDEDFKMVDEWSSVARWSNPESLLEAVAA